MKVPVILLSSLTLVLLFSCNNTPEQTCKYGEPVPIFGKEMPGVASHSFEAKGQDANEKVSLERGMQIEILQSGCDAIRQEFRFLIDEEEQEGENPVEKCGAIFISLSGMDPDLAGLANWGNVILEYSDQLKLGETTQVSEGFFIKIDRIRQGDQTLLIAILSETDN